MNQHICVLDTEQHGVPGCRCGAWYMPLSGRLLTAAFVSRDLQDRLRDCKEMMRLGDAQSLPDAVRLMADSRRHKRLRADRRCRELWELKQRNGFARFIRAAKEKLLQPGVLCVYCGDPEPTGVDHIKPISRWPQLARRLSNLVPACGPCNSQKGGGTPEEWKQRRLAAGLPWPPESQIAQAAARPRTSYGDDSLIGSVEAFTLLGIDRATLTRWVANGRIRNWQKLPGKTGAFLFNRADIERLRDDIAQARAA